MAPKKDKFFEYFDVLSFSDLDKKEGQLEKSLNIAREKIKEINDQDKLNILIERTHEAMDKFFAFSAKWVDKERADKKIRDNDEGRDKKAFVEGLTARYEEQLKELVTTEFRLRHYYKISVDFQKREEEEMDIIPNTEWTKDTQIFLEKYLKKIPAIKEEISRLKEARELLKDLGAKLKDVEKNIHSLFGAKKGKPLFTAYMAGLRQMNETKANAAIAQIQRERGKLAILPGLPNKKTLVNKAKKLKNAYLDNMELLMLSEDRIFLKVDEVSVSLDVAKKEHQQALDLINKYHHPYLKSRVISITKLIERLEQIGLVRDLFMLYLKVVKGKAVELKRFEDIRMYDANITTPLDYMVNEKMAELNYIDKSALEVMDGLKRAIQNRLQKIA